VPAGDDDFVHTAAPPSYLARLTITIRLMPASSGTTSTRS
jgi:hypothetical protein